MSYYPEYKMCFNFSQQDNSNTLTLHSLKKLPLNQLGGLVAIGISASS